MTATPTPPRPQPPTLTDATEPDPRTRAFDYAITELWHWVNNDYAKIRIIEDTWVEIAQRLEAWRDDDVARPTTADDSGR